MDSCDGGRATTPAKWRVLFNPVLFIAVFGPQPMLFPDEACFCLNESDDKGSASGCSCRSVAWYFNLISCVPLIYENYGNYQDVFSVFLVLERTLVSALPFFARFTPLDEAGVPPSFHPSFQAVAAKRLC